MFAGQVKFSQADTGEIKKIFTNGAVKTKGVILA
jgi:hypothetical protein